MAAYVRLLGSPAARTPEGWTPLTSSKASALVCYLAYHRSWVRRSDLLCLLWPEHSEEAARRNLRPMLTRVRRWPFVERIDTDGDLLRWSVKTDVQAFHEALVADRPEQALAMYGGPLMSGLDVADSPAFDDWVRIARSELETARRSAALRVAESLERSGRLDEAAETLGSLLRTDPLDEDAVRRSMRLACLAGDRRAALQAFEEFEASLRAELALAPEAATRALAERIRSGDCHPAGTAAAPPPPTTDAHAFALRTRVPRPTTPFVGRHAEVERAIALLGDPTCSLLTLVGPGGIGKTRLALHLADAANDDFAGNVGFVSCAEVDLPEDLPAAIATAIGCTPRRSGDAFGQLVDALGSERVLLVLDNLEHLVAGVGSLPSLLESCPGLTLLVTSRQRLALRGEWVLDVGGLTCPPPFATDRGAADDLRALETFDAVALFVAAARRSRGRFELDEGNASAVVDVCRALEGMPLAIELAASATRLLRPDELVERLASLPDLLESVDHDASPGQRRVRAVVERSWDLLTPEERTALAALTVFRGGCTLEAAEAVVGVDATILVALVDKSLVRRDEAGRLTLHPLVRHFVARRARDDAEAHGATATRHAAYFLALAARNDGWRWGRRGRHRLDAMLAELDNVEAAWLHAADEGRHDWLLDALDTLGWCAFATGDHARGARLLHYALERVDPGSVCHARLATTRGVLLDEPTLARESIALLEHGAEALERFGAERHLAFALQVLGTRYARHQGARNERAVECFERALAIYEATGDTEGAAMIENNLAYHAPSLAAALRRLDACIERARSGRALRALAHALDTYAEALAYGSGDHAGARAAMLEALDVMAQVGDDYTHAWMRLRCAQVMLRGGSIDDASTVALDVEADGAGFDRHTREALRAAAGNVQVYAALVNGDSGQALASFERAYASGSGSLPAFALAHLLTAAVRASLQADRTADARHWHDVLSAALDDQTASGSFELREAAIVAAALRAELFDRTGDVASFRSTIDTAHRSARSIGALPATLECLLVRASAARRAGHDARAARLASTVHTHFASTAWHRTAASSLLRGLGGRAP
jgi:predicted ATPase/DNA-binding SARP family transcriptional activator